MILERLKEYIDYKGISIAAFERSIGMANASFGKSLKRHGSIGTDKLENILSVYKDISPQWLLLGKGGMIKEDKQGEVVLKATSPSEGIPLIPLSAMAGNFSMEQTVLEYECERYVVPIFKGADFLIPIKGSSMVPHYNSGDVVACRRVPMTNLFFQWNKVYVIDTDQGPLIKRLKPGSDSGHVTIVSDNPSFDPFELPLECIHSVALVIGTIRLE